MASTTEVKTSTRSLETATSPKALLSANAVSEYSTASLLQLKAGENLSTEALTQLTTKLDALNTLEGQSLSLVVLYESVATGRAITRSYESTDIEKLNDLLASYNLSITKNFELDDTSNGLVLRPNGGLNGDDAIEVTREISLIDHVLMVHLKEPTPAVPSRRNSA